MRCLIFWLSSTFASVCEASWDNVELRGDLILTAHAFDFFNFVCNIIHGRFKSNTIANK